MTKRECAIIMAYTGVCMLQGEDFKIFHSYIEDILKRPVFTHELGNPRIADEIKENSTKDFLELCRSAETKNEERVLNGFAEMMKGLWNNQDIELVIKIPKAEYNYILKSNDSIFADCASKECMMHSIKNGIPLPKGHGRLIDADELYNSLEFPTQQFASAFKEVLDDTPTIIEADKEESEDKE